LTKIKKNKARMQFTIRRIYQLVRMVSLYLIGFTKCMDWEYNISDKYAEEPDTWEEKHFKNTFSNGDMHMG